MNIIFDLDGTLIDSAPDIQGIAGTILRSLSKAELTLDETRNFIGEGAAVFVRRMMAARGIEDTPEQHANLLGKFMASYEHAVDKAVFYPGAWETLRAFKSAGHSLALCTNKPEHAARAVVSHMGMGSMFDALMAGGMLDSRKPEPDMLLQTIAALGGGSTLYVGDSEIDAETAKRALVPFALYSGGYRKAAINEIQHDWVFDHFDALPGIVSSLVTATAT